MSIKQTMSTAIPADPNNVRAVVDEANDGKKAVPVELVLKRNDDSTFDQVNDGKSLPVADSAVLAKLSALEAKLDAIMSGTTPATVKLTGSYDQYRLVKISADTTVMAGANYDWIVYGADISSLRKFPYFAVGLSWKIGSSNLNWDLVVWQYMTNTETSSNPIPDSISAIDSLPVGSTNRLHAGRFRNLGNSNILIRVRNKSSQDQILTNLYVVGLDAV